MRNSDGKEWTIVMCMRNIIASATAKIRTHGLGVVVGTFLLLFRCKLFGIMIGGVVTSTRRGPRLHTAGEIQIGRNCAFRNERIRSDIGATRGGRLIVGPRTFVNEAVTIVATDQISIGNNCRIGEFVAIFDTDYHSVDPHGIPNSEPVVIGNNVWIARAAVVLPGTTIGDNSVVAANSVVSSDVPRNSLVAGNPARVIRTLEDVGPWTRT